jgi:hypothetical protein
MIERPYGARCKCSNRETGPRQNAKRYVWAYAAGAHEDIKAVVNDFCESGAEANTKAFLDKWRASLVGYDFSAYKQLMGAAAGQITEVGFCAHARRKFHDLHQVSQSQIAIAIGRNNCLFAGSLRAGQRAAAVMSLIQLAKLNGHDPHAHLKDVLTSSPTHMNSRIDELLPHRWSPAPQADALPHRHRVERSDA